MDKDPRATNLAQVGEALLAAQQQTNQPRPDIQPGQVVGIEGEIITLDEKVNTPAAPKFSRK